MRLPSELKPFSKQLSFDAGAKPMLFRGQAWRMGAAIFLGLVILLTSGCIFDRRSMGAIVDDQTIEIRVRDVLHRGYGPGRGNHIKVIVVNGWVLLVGEVATEAQQLRAGSLAKETTGVVKVVNELQIGNPEGLGRRTSDTFLSGRVKSSLIGAGDVRAARFHVTSHLGVVYLMGRVTPSEGEAAAARVANVKGVRSVVKVLDYIPENDEESEAPTP